MSKISNATASALHRIALRNEDWKMTFLLPTVTEYTRGEMVLAIWETVGEDFCEVQLTKKGDKVSTHSAHLSPEKEAELIAWAS